MYDFRDYGLRFEFQHYNSMDFGPYGVAATLNPMMNQVQETNKALNWGVKNIEVQLLGFRGKSGYEIGPGGMGIPEREELIRLAKLNQVGLTVHGPIVPIDGWTQRGFDEMARKEAEYKILQTIDFADQIGQKTGVSGVPVVVHAAAGTPGNPMPTEEQVVYDVIENKPFVVKKGMIKLDENEARELGLLDHWDPRTGELDAEGVKRYVEEMKLNDRYVELSQLERQKRYLLDIQISNPNIRDRIEQYLNGKIPESNLTPEERSFAAQVLAIDRAERRIKNEIERIKELKEKGESLIKPIDNISLERAADTIADVAAKAFQRTKTKPMIVIENITPEMALGNPEQVAELVKKAREKFAKQLQEKMHLHPADARAWAEKMIGMTLDVGHMNIWRKYLGDKEFEKKYKEWVKKVAPYVKHVHITDNWGDQDAHLPVGWGNAPNEETMKILREYGFHGKMVAETPFPSEWGGEMAGLLQSMYHFGAPIAPGGPSWEWAGSSYFMAGYQFTQPSYGPYPQANVQMYGLGFSGLPFPLGGQQKKGFSNAPMS